MDRTPAIRHPLDWSRAHIAPGSLTDDAMQSTAAAPVDSRLAAMPVPRRIGVGDLGAALKAGLADFAAFRTDVIFLCIMYPVAGLVLSRVVFGTRLFQLAFPLLAGFALLGPLVATGLYEMSRQRAAGRPVSWGSAFDAFRSPAIGSIVALGLVLLAAFAAWLGVAQLIYDATLRLDRPQSIGDFTQALFHSSRGIAMIVGGMSAGFLFAVLVLSISVVSFPLLLDRRVSVGAAIALSLRVVRENPMTMAAWGFIVAAGLVLGSLPFLMGLALVVPILGHATWHLYRRIVPAA